MKIQKGSLTIEAALTVPFVISVMMCAMQLGIKMQSEVKSTIVMLEEAHSEKSAVEKMYDLYKVNQLVGETNED